MKTSTASDWSVKVLYSEPGFDESLRRPTVYRTWRWHGQARDSAQATERALRQFDALWTLSGVGWVRQVHLLSVATA